MRITGGSGRLDAFERTREASLPGARPSEESPTPTRMAAQALLLVRDGHVQAAIGVYRALAARYPERASAAEQQIAAIQLLLASDEI